MKKKRIIFCILLVLVTSGCTTIQKSSYEDLIKRATESKYKLCNHILRGYKYYLPVGLRSVSMDEYNEIIKGENTTYYLYTDLVSFYNKAKVSYEEKSNIYYSKTFTKNKNKGIVNVRQDKDNNYVVQVIYNYARVEVIATELNLKSVIANALTIVTTMNYNSDVISSLIGVDSFSSLEETVSIFDKTEVDNDQLEVEETYTGNEEEDYDPDVIN